MASSLNLIFHLLIFGFLWAEFCQCAKRGKFQRKKKKSKTCSLEVVKNYCHNQAKFGDLGGGWRGGMDKFISSFWYANGSIFLRKILQVSWIRCDNKVKIHPIYLTQILLLLMYLYFHQRYLIWRTFEFWLIYMPKNVTVCDIFLGKGRGISKNVMSRNLKNWKTLFFDRCSFVSKLVCFNEILPPLHI